ncbi:hypothetical protein [Rhizobacter sp. OV335]|jgi:hypothetical protein|uniref:hypothetical protein n=1 Tax=Rhizobacter sp. OV335 TaxID=1500264 RepID=UPI000918E0A6|nr:hypothetical protein [Rhizobacter sp. OV335]SHN10896.1 hypothetical protein SAMN02787076_03332 [Rhizobacter sp. OV335]
MTTTPPTANDLKAEVEAAWAVMEAPPSQDMALMDWEYGEEAKAAFVGVRPADVDIDSVGFKVATPLLDLPAHAAAAYLGPYLVSLLEGFQVEQAVGFPIDIKTRSHTIFTLASSGFWVDIAAPYLGDACVAAVGRVAQFVVDHGDVFEPAEGDARGLERLVRSVDRRLNPSGSR